MIAFSIGHKLKINIKLTMKKVKKRILFWIRSKTSTIMCSSEKKISFRWSWIAKAIRKSVQLDLSFPGTITSNSMARNFPLS